MSPIRESAEILRRAKEAGLIKPSPITDAPETRAPNIPTYPNAPNNYLRSTLPANLIQSPDGQRQFFNPATPQVRLFAPTLNSSAFNGASIQSGVASFQVSNHPIPPIVPFPPAPSSGQFYEINGNGIFEQMYSINGVLLP